MDTAKILMAINEEIGKLQQARELLVGNAATGKRGGQLTGSVNRPPTASMKTTRRVMTAEGRARIGAAQKKRWAAQKKANKNTKPIVTTLSE